MVYRKTTEACQQLKAPLQFISLSIFTCTDVFCSRECLLPLVHIIKPYVFLLHASMSRVIVCGLVYTRQHTYTYYDGVSTGSYISEWQTILHLWHC